jgi:hypothetical protein
LGTEVCIAVSTMAVKTGRFSSIAAALTTTFLLARCAAVPKLMPYYLQKPYENVFNAPIVIVGVLLSDTPVRPPIPSQRNGGYPLQLRKLSVRVENVLRGNVNTGTAVVYYFALAGPIDGPIPLGQWQAGDRKILWLRFDSGVFRTACDGHDSCTMPVTSGAHPHYQPDPNKPLGYALADIFFTRGEGTTDGQFARGVEWGAPSTVPESYLFEKLQQLAGTEVQVVRTAACKQLSYYRQNCVPSRAKP